MRTAAIVTGLVTAVALSGVAAAEGERTRTSCQFVNNGSYAELTCQREVIPPCEDRAGPVTDADRTEKDDEAFAVQDKDRDGKVRVVRRGCARTTAGNLADGEVQVVKRGKASIVKLR